MPMSDCTDRRDVRSIGANIVEHQKISDAWLRHESIGNDAPDCLREHITASVQNEADALWRYLVVD